MSRHLVIRLLETFFRRWWLYIVPVVLLAILGFQTVSNAASRYRSVATFEVASTTLLSSLSDVPGDPNYGYDSPAVATSKQIAALLETDQFVKAVVTRAGLDDAVASGQVTLNEIRGSVAAFPASTNFVKIWTSSRDPALPPTLATATIDEFISLVIESQIADSESAQAFYTDLAVGLEGDVDVARSAVDQFIIENPAPTLPQQQRPETEQLELSRLQANLSRAEARYDSAQGKALDAQLALEQAKADLAQRLRLVDAPEPAVPQSQLKDSIFTMVTYLMLGLLLSIGLVVIAMLLDHSVRTPDELRRLGLRVLAVVPEVPEVRKADRRRRRERGRRGAADGSAPDRPAPPRRLWGPPAPASGADADASSGTSESPVEVGSAKP